MSFAQKKDKNARFMPISFSRLPPLFDFWCLFWSSFFLITKQQTCSFSPIRERFDAIYVAKCRKKQS